MDGLREWLGWNHNEQNDTRGTRTEIESLAKNLSQVRLSFPVDFPEEDEMFMRDPLEEVWMQVDLRWEKALNFIFENDPNKVICITGNNRAIQSGLRIIGHDICNETLENNFGIMNMKHGAVVAFLVRRYKLDDAEIESTWLERKQVWRMEEQIITQKKAEDDVKACEEVMNMSCEKLESLLSLLGPLERQVVVGMRCRSPTLS